MIPLVTVTINKKPFQVSPVIADRVKRAAAAMFAATGTHPTITSAYRSPEQQAELYRKMKAANPRAVVALPGRSFHEKGLALDIANYLQAEKYFHAEGFLNALPSDRIHFSFGEFNPLLKVKKYGFIVLLAVISLIYLNRKTIV